MDKESLINGYFENSLSQNQMMEFEQLLKSDVDFASEVDFQTELQRSLKKDERQEIKQMFGELNSRSDDTQTKVVRLRPWLAAASIAIIVGLGAWLLFFTNEKVNTDMLYAANFAPYENVVNPIERGNELEDLKTKAFTAYENSEFILASKLFEELNRKQNDEYIDFYGGIVQMALENHEKAIPLLQGYINNNGELKDRAHWYLALAHLKLGATEKAQDELKNLVQMGSFKTEEAQNLLKVLD